MTTQSYSLGASGTDCIESPFCSNAGTCGSWYETSEPAFWRSAISFTAGDSRMSAMSGLYATPRTRIREPFSERWREWFSACDTRERQKYGIDSLTLPASSMNSV
jgi:hypothetical protein